MKTSEVLLAARELLAAPNGWTKEAFARTKKGSATSPMSRMATCFCALGAIERITDQPANMGTKRYLYRVIKDWELLPNESIPHFNDCPDTTQLDVVVAFEKAALLAMEDEKKETK